MIKAAAQCELAGAVKVFDSLFDWKGRAGALDLPLVLFFLLVADHCLIHSKQLLMGACTSPWLFVTTLEIGIELGRLQLGIGFTGGQVFPHIHT